MNWLLTAIFAVSLIGQAVTAFEGPSFCDPQGTRDDFGRILPGSGKRCFCHPGFTGPRCESVLNCQSGNLRVLNCTNPREGEESLAKKCNGDMESFKYCDCFFGYIGPRCERRNRALGHLPVVRNNVEEEMRKAVQEVHDNTPFLDKVSPGDFSEREELDQMFEEQLARLNREFWFMIAIIFLLSLIAICSIYIYFSVMKSCHRIYLKKLWHSTITQLGHAVVPLPKDLHPDCEAQTAPPQYSEAAPLIGTAPPPYQTRTNSVSSTATHNVVALTEASPSAEQAENMENTAREEFVRPLRIHV